VNTGIRQWISEHARLATGLFAALVLIAVGSIVAQVVANRHKFPNSSPDAFFSVDDGKTFFVASTDNVPPFDYKGQQAVHAYVFECDGKRFVGYLERYSPDAHKAILDGKRSREIEMFGRELKKPGTGSWIKSGNINLEAPITDVRGPGGREVVPVEP